MGPWAKPEVSPLPSNPLDVEHDILFIDVAIIYFSERNNHWVSKTWIIGQPIWCRASSHCCAVKIVFFLFVPFGQLLLPICRGL